VTWFIVSVQKQSGLCEFYPEILITDGRHHVHISAKDTQWELYCLLTIRTAEGKGREGRTADNTHFSADKQTNKKVISASQ
jgi:hypothetical protein